MKGMECIHVDHLFNTNFILNILTTLIQSYMTPCLPSSEVRVKGCKPPTCLLAESIYKQAVSPSVNTWLITCHEYSIKAVPNKKSLLLKSPNSQICKDQFNCQCH